MSLEFYGEEPSVFRTMDTLLITGTFNEIIGKESLLGSQLSRAFNYASNVDFINGGNISKLDEYFKKAPNYRIILWMPENTEDKYLSRIKSLNKTALLVQLEKNKNTTFQTVEKMLRIHSNLCLIIEGPTFQIIDPLGNIWYDGTQINEACSKIVILIKYLSSLTRMPSISNLRSLPAIQIDERFLSLVRSFSKRFSALLNESLNKERYLGNISTRCMYGFPSIKENDAILISRRNINKDTITQDQFVPVSIINRSVYYAGYHKPSVDAPTQFLLYQYYKNVNYILHGHVYIRNAPMTKNYIPCGCLEEAKEIKNLIQLPSSCNFAVNLIGHGCLILAKDLDYFNEIEMISRNFPEDLKNLKL